jgi:2-polyprenyl-6-methoxyphenol hydroxylase-like FAD-dependent oxidoreductase
MADTLIAGAGLGGLTAALALIQRGHRGRNCGRSVPACNSGPMARAS